MIFEHFGINVPDAKAMADWYIRHLDMKAVIANAKPPYAHFLADSTGRVVMELYSNPADPIPDYAAQHHLRFHFAFAVADPQKEKERLLGAGATFVVEDRLPDGSVVITLRDPWKIPLQLARRAKPMA
jgi:glyoxylase I family protein